MPALRGLATYGVARTNFRSRNAIRSLDSQIVLYDAALGGSALSSGRKQLLSDFAAGLRADGVLQKLDNWNVLASENTTQALLDIVRLSNISPQNGPTHTVDRGYACSEVTLGSKFLDLLLQPAGAGNYLQNASHFAFWLRTNHTAGNNGVEMGVSTAAAGFGCNLSVNYDGNCYVAMNDNNADGGRTAAADTRGHWVVTRINSTTINIYLNGILFGSSTITSTGYPNLNFCLNGGYNSFASGAWDLGTNSEFAMESIGGPLDATQAAAYYARSLTFMTAIGAA